MVIRMWTKYVLFKLTPRSLPPKWEAQIVEVDYDREQHVHPEYVKSQSKTAEKQYEPLVRLFE